MPRHVALDLGPLPVSLVNATLDTELEPGNVRLSVSARNHIAERHPDDYDACLAALTGGCVQEPTYIGQDPKHARAFLLVKRMGREDGRQVLVAIGFEPDGAGAYGVYSCYLINAKTVEERRQSGRLRIPMPR